MSNKEIGIKLASLRGEKTQKTVAEELGISLSALAMYESGHRVPRDAIKVKIAEYYGRSVQEIFFENKCHEKGQEAGI